MTTLMWSLSGLLRDDLWERDRNLTEVILERGILPRSVGMKPAS